MIGGVILFAPTCIFSIRYAWNVFCLVLSKVERWRLVWHKHVVSWFSFILWLVVREVLSTQDKLMSYGVVVKMLIIWYDMCSKCLIPFNHHPWANVVVWLSILGRGNSL